MSEWNGQEQQLDQLLTYRQFYHVFQPIYLLSNWKIAGYEALLRTPLFQQTEEIFYLARKVNQLYDIDVLSMMNVFAFFNRRKNIPSQYIFVNIFPSTITHPSFFSFIDRPAGFYHHIVLEINEMEIISDPKKLKACVLRLKEMGFSIAIDDFGKGETSLETSLFFEPTFVKLDRFFAHHLAISKEKVESVKYWNQIFQERGIQVILEGIERPDDLAMAKAIGVKMGQGFLLGEPAPL